MMAFLADVCRGYYPLNLSPASDRRTFIVHSLSFASAAAMIVFAGTCNRAFAEIVSEDDSRLLNRIEHFRTLRGRARGYFARPRGAGPPRPAILVIHGNDGLTPFYRDIARRLALGGFFVLAPDFLSFAETAPEDVEAARGMIEALDERTALAIAVGASEFLVSMRDTLPRVGVVGFSWGGDLAQELAIDSRLVAAAVSYYGRPLDPRRVARLRAPLMVHGAERDDPVDRSDFREALEAAEIGHSLHVYEDVEPDFHDYTSKQFDEDAAGLAWDRSVAHLKEALE